MAKRGPGRPFPKGVSGNPTGNPPKSQEEKDIRKMALKYADDALQTLVTALKSDQDASKISAAKELLDRGFGKPSQPIAHSGNIGHESTLADLD